MSDGFTDVDINLADYGIMGEKLIFRCWEADFVEKGTTVHENLVNPHSALMYMIKDVPKKPVFIYSDVNVYLGENVFKSEFIDGRLTIYINNGCEKFVTDRTKVFAYYPISFEKSIMPREKIIARTEEYIITEYETGDCRSEKIAQSSK